jgi:uncharacterized protein (DUF952 family)
MRWLYHLVTPEVWEQGQDQPYRAASLDTEGFIHCSNLDQVVRSANRFYAEAPNLLLLCIPAERLTSPLKDENSGSGELFPHIYGPIERAAVAAVRPLHRDGTGHWALPPDLPPS